MWRRASPLIGVPCRDLTSSLILIQNLLSAHMSRPLRGTGSARWALLGGVRFARLGGGVAALWSGASLVCGVFLGSSLKTERSATYCSLVFRMGLGELFVSHGITHWQPRFQPS